MLPGFIVSLITTATTDVRDFVSVHDHVDPVLVRPAAIARATHLEAGSGGAFGDDRGRVCGRADPQLRVRRDLPHDTFIGGFTACSSR